MTSLPTIWIAFFLCAALIAFGGMLLSRYGDVIAHKTGMSGSWIGLVLLATVTSLPELVTGASAVTLANEPNIAVGNIFGSCVFNLAALAVVDFLYRKEPIYRRASQNHILSAAFGTVMIGFTASSILLGHQLSTFSLAHTGIYAPFIVLLYVLAIRTVFFHEKNTATAVKIEQQTIRYADITLQQAIRRYAAAAVVVVGAGIGLPFVAVQLAEAMGWHKTFVGTLLVAGVTTLPELTATIAALRIGAVDMAIANLLGSNLFNMQILVIDDLLFLKGPILSHVSSMHVASAMSAVIMSGVVIIGLLYRPASRLFRTVGWISIGLFTVYLLNATALYLYGE